MESLDPMSGFFPYLSHCDIGSPSTNINMYICFNPCLSIFPPDNSFVVVVPITSNNCVFHIRSQKRVLGNVIFLPNIPQCRKKNTVRQNSIDPAILAAIGHHFIV